MKNQRKYERIKCNIPITLMDRSGSIHEAMMENVSFRGASIKVKDGIRDYFDDGDVCNFILHRETAKKLSGRVVRCGAVNIGVKFVTRSVR